MRNPPGAQRPTPAECYIAVPDGASLAGLLAHDTPEEAEKDVQVWADAGIAGSVRRFREVVEPQERGSEK
jgi:hypothetical protein